MRQEFCSSQICISTFGARKRAKGPYTTEMMIPMSLRRVSKTTFVLIRTLYMNLHLLFNKKVKAEQRRSKVQFLPH